MMRAWRVLTTLFFILLSIGFIIFFLKNMEAVTLDFVYYETVPLPKALLAAVAFVAGAVVGIITMMGWMWSLYGDIRSLKKEKKILERELKGLRRRPSPGGEADADRGRAPEQE